MEWRDIGELAGYEHLAGRYRISDTGVVYSVKSKRRIGGVDKRGYVIASLPKMSPQLVHRLVALAFIPNPDNYEHVAHLDGNDQNNDAKNLRWVSRKSEVDEEPVEVKRLSYLQSLRLKMMLIKTLKSVSEIAGLFDVSECTVREICYGRIYKDDRFEYPLRDLDRKMRHSTIEKIDTVRELLRLGLSYREIVNQTGIAKETIAKIKSGWYEEL